VFELNLEPDLITAIVIDISVLVGCAILLLRFGRLAHSHPGVVYLIFHSVVVTSRMIAISAGAETLFSSWSGLFEPIDESEIIRAALVADMALVAMTLAFIRVSIVEKRRALRHDGAATTPVTLSVRHIWAVAGVAFPIGLIGLLVLGDLPGIDMPTVDLGSWSGSSWVLVTMTWSGLSLLALIYWYGFKWWLSIPMTVYLLIMSVQGYHRFRAVIPMLLLVQIFLDRRARRWPPVLVTVGIALLMVSFYPMKTIGRMAREGATIGKITESSSEILREVVAGQSSDQMMLDQMASTVTLVDRADKLFYGSPYLSLLVSPVPRQLWPSKPGLADHLREISVPSRPMSELGMVPTFVGEAYLNFGLIGVGVLSFLTAYWLARLYFRAYRGNYYSILRFAYLLVACNLIQVYRDGLMSLFVFTLINMMPLSAIVMLHQIVRVRRKRQHIPLYPLPTSPT
jgi:hypothetical protein